MSNPDPKLTKKEKKGPASALGEGGAEPSSSPGFGAYVIGGVVGLLLLAVLWEGFSSPAKAPSAEFAHLVVLAEFADLEDQAVRADLARLQDQLKTLTEPAAEVLGPTSYPILLPGAGEGDAPRALSLAALTKAEAQEAIPYLRASKWWSPRIFGAELKSACFRVGPALGNRFPAGSRARLEEILDSFKDSSLALSAYSHDLRFQEPAARTKINVEFGVQTASAVGTLQAGKSCLTEPSLMFGLQGSLKAVEHPQLRAVVSLADFWRYVLAVRGKSPALISTQITEEERLALIQLTKECGAGSYVSADGAQAFVFVSTSAEDQEGRDVCYFLCGNAPGKSFVLHPAR